MTNPLRLDPTRTGHLRSLYERGLASRLKKIERAVVALFVKENPLGLVENARWQFLSDSDKIAAFKDWLQSQFEAGLLDGEGADLWASEYIKSAYKQAAVNAYKLMHPPVPGKGPEFYNGGMNQFLSDSFGLPITQKRLALLYSRNFEYLKGITDTMSQQLSVQLGTALAHGWGPREIARKMSNTIAGLSDSRALRIARTEIVHAYAEGSLDSLERMGVDKVGVEVEWSTAGDNRVCPQCASLQGAIFTIEEARGLIPRHPNCRCAWMPASVREKRVDLEKQLRGSARKQAIDESVQKERPSSSKDDAFKKSTWQGADL